MKLAFAIESRMTFSVCRLSPQAESTMESLTAALALSHILFRDHGS